MDCFTLLKQLQSLVEQLDSQLDSHESAALKQETIGLEYRLEYLRDLIERLVNYSRRIQVAVYTAKRDDSHYAIHTMYDSHDVRFALCDLHNVRFA